MGLRNAEAPALTPAVAQRLHIGALGAAPLTDSTALGGVRFWDALADLPSANPTPMHPRGDRQAVTDRVLTLAGLYIINAPAPAALLDDPRARDCLHTQQLEFRQCVSVSHTPDEDAACLARHGLRNIAACLSF